MTMPDMQDPHERDLAYTLTTALLLEMRDWMDKQVRAEHISPVDRASWGDLATRLQSKYGGQLDQMEPGYVQP